MRSIMIARPISIWAWHDAMPTGGGLDSSSDSCSLVLNVLMNSSTSLNPFLLVLNV